MGNWGIWSFQNTSALPLLILYTFPLLHHGSFPWATVLQKQTALACDPSTPSRNPPAAWAHPPAPAEALCSLQCGSSRATGEQATSLWPPLWTVWILQFSTLRICRVSQICHFSLSWQLPHSTFYHALNNAITEAQLMGSKGSWGGSLVILGEIKEET